MKHCSRHWYSKINKIQSDFKSLGSGEEEDVWIICSITCDNCHGGRGKSFDRLGHNSWAQSLKA